MEVCHMFSRYSLVAFFAFSGLGAQLACSAQGDQQDTGLDDGNDDGTSGNSGTGGTISFGGTSSNGGSGGVIVTGGTTGSGGTSGSGGTQGGIQCVGNGAGLRALLRDFQPPFNGLPGHPDFEPHFTKPSAINFYNMVERGIVQPRIDEATRKPLYAGGAGGTNTTMGPTYFPSWFSDTPTINMTIDYVLPFVEEVAGSGIYVFDRAPFLPIDDGATCPVTPQSPCLMGNSRNYMTHNYSLTLEFHTKFVYKPGLSFRFSGDDDVWVFVNGALAIDLGGIHQRTEATLNLDSAQPPLEVGKEYILDFFWADRHVTQANFRVETSLDFINCSIDVPK
jgi:fibro-slime domain-containing protein